ncbi:MAG: hypothetical protein EOP11_08980 [Proteobacteria bacterium]|nr:MAG: hypothetical protein EOP11_08980 [Pseudomonadota bacterium]
MADRGIMIQPPSLFPYSVWMKALLAGLIALLPLHAAGAETLSPGLCPFEAKLIKKNFTAAIRKDYGDGFIAEAFGRRERWYGPCARAELIGRDRWKLDYPEAEVSIELQRRGGKIEQFEFQHAEFKADSFEKFRAFFAKNFSRGSFLIDGAGGVAFDKDKYLAVGEAHDLLLAAEVEKGIAEGRLSNQRKFALQNTDRVKDSDDLAEEKEGFSVSIADLKDRIFNRQDRTAADMALRIVGAKSLEEDRPAAGAFLSKREFAWLMGLSPAKMGALKKENARAEAARLNQPGEYPPFTLERYDHLAKAGWFATTAELCAAAASLTSVPEITGGMASRNFLSQRGRWKSVVYHAARDFGIAQTTWVAQAGPRKAPRCFSLTINEASAVDESTILEMEDRVAKLFNASN